MNTVSTTGRDHRIDIFRGLALITIFVNHVPGQVYERLTSRNFGFSDAAEAFVLMSGIAVGLAYSRNFRAGNLRQAILKVWRRAGTLYVAHILTSVIAIAIVAASVLFLDATEIVVRRVNFTRVLDMPLAAMIGLPTLSFQLGYFNILPLYFVLLVFSPAYILIGVRSRWALLGMSTLIWCAAGIFRVNFPNYPNPGGWFFNPLSWQLVYAIGIAAGLSITERRKLVPYRPWCFTAAVTFLLFSLLWIKLRMGGLPGSQHMPFFISGFDKTFLSLPRLLHVLALAYVLTNVPAISRLLSRPAFRPVELIGQNGLTVFVTGSILAIALQVFRAHFETTIIQDGALLLSGILIQYGVARFRFEVSDKKRVRGPREVSASGKVAEMAFADNLLK